jgi:hypothetical protein
MRELAEHATKDAGTAAEGTASGIRFAAALWRRKIVSARLRDASNPTTMPTMVMLGGVGFS